MNATPGCWMTTATKRGQGAHDVLFIHAPSEEGARDKARAAGYDVGSATVEMAAEYSRRFATVVLL